MKTVIVILTFIALCNEHDYALISVEGNLLPKNLHEMFNSSSETSS